MNWQKQWIDDVLAQVPPGGYRTRLEAELRDHLDSQCRALMESGRAPDAAQAEALRAMGEPERLKAEYLAAWRRSWPGRLKALRFNLNAWAGGFVVMGVVHFLIAWVLNTMWSLALSLPGDSYDKWVRFIRGTVGDWNNSLFWRHLFPLTLALIAGAYFLGHEFRASRHPAPLITVGLSLHWAYITAFMLFWQAIDHHHRPFWEAFWRQLYYGAWYYALTFALCIFLGLVFGDMAVKSRWPAAA